jgi:hypothetical protein
LDSKLSKALSDLGEHWNVIEGRLKEAEQLRSEAVIPAINELRYAGRQIVDAWGIATQVKISKKEHERFDRCFIVAKQYLYNADHDVTDSICFFIHKRLKTLLELYSKRRLRNYYPEIDSLLKRVQEVNETITTSRRGRPERNGLYEKLAEEYVPYLTEQFRQLQVVERITEEQDRRRRFLTCGGYIVGTIGLVASIIQVYSYWETCSESVNRLITFLNK